MVKILALKGHVHFPIHIDPGVWIFDERKFDMDTWHPEQRKDDATDYEQYLKQVSSQWDKEITEGATLPPNGQEKRTKKQILTETSFGIPFKPFILNAEPDQNVTTLVIHTASGDLEYPLEDAMQFIIGFSIKGKPISEEDGGPIFIYHGDGSNRTKPIDRVNGFTLK